MKKLTAIITFFCLLSLSAVAQSGKPIKIYFLNGVINLGTTDLKVVADGNKTISVKQRSWVIIESVSDSVGFLVNDKPYFIHFEPGKSYYFSAHKEYGSTITFVKEESEQTFMMMVSISSVRGPEEYKLGKLVN